MHNNIDESQKCLEDAIRKTYMSVVWAHKIQEKQADILSCQYKRLEKIKILFSSITACGISAILFRDEFWIKLLSAIVALITVGIASYFKSFALPEMISAHSNTANRLWLIREKLQLLILDIHLGNKDIAVITEEYINLIDRLGIIYAEAPRTTDEAVDAAECALNVKKDNDFTDENIDNNLPPALRRGNN